MNNNNINGSHEEQPAATQAASTTNPSAPVIKEEINSAAVITPSNVKKETTEGVDAAPQESAPAAQPFTYAYYNPNFNPNAPLPINEEQYIPSAMYPDMQDTLEEELVRLKKDMLNEKLKSEKLELRLKVCFLQSVGPKIALYCFILKAIDLHIPHIKNGWVSRLIIAPARNWLLLPQLLKQQYENKTKSLENKLDFFTSKANRSDNLVATVNKYFQTIVDGGENATNILDILMEFVKENEEEEKLRAELESKKRDYSTSSSTVDDDPLSKRVKTDHYDR